MEECGIKALWLPRYSPDYNPIELLWAFMKPILRKRKAMTREKLDEAIKFALGSVPTDYIMHWFQHCWYIVDL